MVEDCKIRGRRIRRIQGDAITVVFEVQGDVAVVYFVTNAKPFDPGAAQEKIHALAIARSGCAFLSHYPRQHA